MEITRDNWLILAGLLKKGEQINIFPRGDLTYQIAYAALKAQYPDMLFDTYEHGANLYIKCGTFRYGCGAIYNEYYSYRENYWLAVKEKKPKEEINHLLKLANQKRLEYEQKIESISEDK